MWIIYIKLTQNFWKQCAPNFISCEFAAIQTSLVQGGLEIPIKVTVQWEDERAREILRRKTEEFSYHLREMDRYEDQLNSIEEPGESKGKTLQEALTQVWWLSTHEAVVAIYSAWTLLILSLEHETASSNKDGTAKARAMI